MQEREKQRPPQETQRQTQTTDEQRKKADQQQPQTQTKRRATVQRLHQGPGGVGAGRGAVSLSWPAYC
jgi:hypothetical protein